jgi:uncharacterized membrane protein YphA (DoxX/SURF4 family)
MKLQAMFRRSIESDAPGAIMFIRVLVGGVFLSEGIQKFIFPDTLGVGRFAKIGIPSPEILAPFVGVCEIVCGVLFLLGLLTRFAALVMMIDIIVAIASTKIPMLGDQGFWAVAHDGRADYAMILGCFFLFLAGGGTWSVDAIIHRVWLPSNGADR